jgi:3-hydroxyisobutyrate dehydrogenase-like beta-hydroxyacid dehydrogenase
MTTSTIGVLHPGEMGVSLAVAAQQGGHRVLWASAGRGAATRARATEHAFDDVGDLATLCARSDLILCICPPHAAEAVAAAVVDGGFGGVYVDANAIEPARMRRIERALTAAGIDVVDGGVIGGPAWTPGSTYLYLSGVRAPEVAAAFGAGPLATETLGPEVGTASALKMCYAATTKGTTALLAAALASAERLGVRAALEAQWARDDPGSAERSGERVRRSARKAWRFAGEMEEIAATFAAAGLPSGFHAAAAELYRRLAPYKDAPDPPSLAEVLAALLEGDPAGPAWPGG